jgi:ribosomal protein L32
MSDYSSCPNCGRRAEKALSSNFFPVYKCKDCGEEYCRDCGGRSCPKCGSSKSSEVGKAYAR